MKYASLSFSQSRSKLWKLVAGGALLTYICSQKSRFTGWANFFTWKQCFKEATSCYNLRGPAKIDIAHSIRFKLATTT
ncbi:hypothetical protein POPTR_006G225133v4 [Populus trichocarpa]|uniref:Uncharacterized protein n=1 Tax=Populus trichocarpa TaxID=3694 RepID=A0ACC0SVV1_POPTR|nr:hypothetical protein POPTR_006G225133v4 [Populus trichocarpa]